MIKFHRLNPIYVYNIFIYEEIQVLMSFGYVARDCGLHIKILYLFVLLYEPFGLRSLTLLARLTR